MKVPIPPRPLLDNIPKPLEPTARPRAPLTPRQRPRRLVRHEPHVVPLLLSRSDAARHALHPHVAQERDQVAHAPRAGPVHAVRGEFLARGGAGVEDPERGRDEGGHFAVREGEEEGLVLRPAGGGLGGGRGGVEEVELALQPGEAEVGG